MKKKENKDTIISKLREYFSKCPLFDKTSPFYTDFNSENPSNYSLNSLPGTRMTKDILQNKYYIRNFAITSREYTPSDLERIENLGLYEQLQEWVEEQDDEENYPNLGKNLEVTGLYVTNSGSLYENDPKNNIGLYQIQLQISYTKYKK